MKLYYSTNSAFARKVRLAAAALRLDDRIEEIPVDPAADEAVLRALNPLAKIPVLVDASEAPIYDSGVICRYLDRRYGDGRVVPHDDAGWLATSRLEAMADGVIEAGMQLRSTLAYGDQGRAAADRQRRKVDAGLGEVERFAGSFADAWTLGEMTVVCALQWLEFRLGAEGFLAARPACRQWLERVSQRADVRRTAPG